MKILSLLSFVLKENHRELNGVVGFVLKKRSERKFCGLVRHAVDDFLGNDGVRIH